MQTEGSYNEAFDEAGALRPPYVAFRDRTGKDPFNPSIETVTSLTNRPLGDRYTILPIPLILDDREYREIIAPGVQQRALALQSFFHDLACGDFRVIAATSLPIDRLSRILAQDGMGGPALARLWTGRRREDVRFVYAPDLVRAPDGRWRILEDNFGCVGGVVDSHLVCATFLAQTGTHLHPSVPKSVDLACAASEFLSRVGKQPASSDVVALLGPECSSGDSEARRKRRVLEELGMRVLSTSELEDARRRGLQSDDVHAIVNFDMRGWSPESELTDDMFGARHVPMMMAPAVEGLGNKALLPFLDEIVEFYSGQAPLLRSATTEICSALPHDPSGWVLKRSRGCQGTEVFFLDEMSDIERSAIDRTVAGWGKSDEAVLQRRVHASYLPLSPAVRWHRFQVELRPLAFVVGDSACVVGEHMSARASSNLGGSRPGNMSQGAHYLCVIREPTLL